MSLNDIQILPFDVKGATQAEYAALNEHTNLLRKERLPDDPPMPLDEHIQYLHSLPPFVDLRLWAAWTPDQAGVVAMADVVLLRMEENHHLAQFEITVLPEYRRQGLGKQLLGLVADTARQDDRRLLLTNTTDRVPGGAAFMQRHGAQKGLETHLNQLRIDELDRGLVHDWLERGQASLTAFELGLWEGPYPDDKLQEVCELYDLTNQQPHGELEIEDMHLTPEQIRQAEANIFARGSQRWTFYLVERLSGRFAGYTETVWNPNRPEILSQDMTGVFPQYRNQGLGRLLKAAMLDKVLRDRPQVKYVRTGNADSNSAMLKINHQLGFKPYLANALWQVETHKVLEYLNA